MESDPGGHEQQSRTLLDEVGRQALHGACEHAPRARVHRAVGLRFDERAGEPWITRAQRMPHRLLEVFLVREPSGGATADAGVPHRVALALTERGQVVAQEAVKPEPLAVRVEWHQKEPLVAKQVQAAMSHAVARSHSGLVTQGVQERLAEAVQNGGVQQEPADGIRLMRDHLGQEVGAHAPRERVYGVGPGGRWGGLADRELEARDPPFGCDRPALGHTRL